MSDLLILLEQARVLYNLRRYRDAEKKLYGALAFDPRNTDVLALLCECKLTLGNVKEGKEIAISIMGIEPENAVGHVLMAEASARSGNAFEAGFYMMQALRIDARNVNYMAMHSGYLLMQGDEPAAVQLAVNALKIDPENVPALAALGTAKFALEDFEEAMNAFHRGLALDPENAKLLHNIGRMLKETGTTASAKAMFLDSLRNDPNFNAAALGLAGVSLSDNPIYKFHYSLVSLFKQSHVTRISFFAGAFFFLMLFAEAAWQNFPWVAKVMAVASWGFLLILMSVFIIPSTGSSLVVFKEQYSQVFNWQRKTKAVSIAFFYLFSIALLIAGISLSQPTAAKLMYYSWAALIAPLLIHVLLSDEIRVKGRVIAFLAAVALFGGIYLVATNIVSFDTIVGLYLYLMAASIIGALLFPFRKLQD